MGKKKLVHAKEESEEEEEYDPKEDEMDVEDDDHREEDPEIKKAKQEEDDYVMNASNDEEETKSPKKISKGPKTEPKEAKSIKKTFNKQTTLPALLDRSYSIEDNYFYKPLLESEWNEIKKFLSSYFTKSETKTESLKELFEHHPNIIKAQENITQLHTM